MKHTLCKQFKVGDRLTARLYPMKCSERFERIPPGGEMTGEWKRSEDPTALCVEALDCVVVGFKRAIMAGYKFVEGRTHGGGLEGMDEYEQAKATGKSQECLVVVREGSTNFQPFLVRPKEVVKKESA